jgi:hypothetical protein
LVDQKKWKDKIRMKIVKTGHLLIIISLMVMVLVLNPGLGSATDKDGSKSAISIIMAAEYPGVEVPLE